MLGIAGNFLYVFWYSKNNRPENSLLSKGSILPEFTLKTIDGELITSQFIVSEPVLMLFYRGNWCPLCMKQIDEISAIADELSYSGVKIYLIGAQSLDETRKIADQYSDTPLEFLFDPYFRAIGVLNLLHPNGIPRGLSGFDRDTVYPTVIFADRGGEILWTDQSDNYRLRPKPKTLLALKSTYGI